MRDAVTLLAIAIIVGSVSACTWQRDLFERDVRIARIQADCRK